MRVIHVLESIQIHHDHSKGRIRPTRVDDLGFQVFVQGPAVGQPGNCVSVGFSADALMQAGVRDGNSRLVCQHIEQAHF